jgi:hypothetical protein
VLWAAPAAATTHVPVTFGDLIARADVIFIGEVTDVRPYPVRTREGVVVMTRVIFRVTDGVFGTSSALEALDFFGGEWNGLGMAVVGMPRFAVGDRRVIFARRGRSVSPIVGFSQGVLRVVRDRAGVERVLQWDGRPLSRVQSFGARTPAGAAGPEAAMSLSVLRQSLYRLVAQRPH